MVCTHELDISSKAGIIMLQSTEQKRLSNKESLRGAHGSPWEGEKIEWILLMDWGAGGYENGRNLVGCGKRVLGKTSGIVRPLVWGREKTNSMKTPRNL